MESLDSEKFAAWQSSRNGTTRGFSVDAGLEPEPVPGVLAKYLRMKSSGKTPKSSAKKESLLLSFNEKTLVPQKKLDKDFFWNLLSCILLAP